MGKLTSNSYSVVITFLCFLYVSGLNVRDAEYQVKSIFRTRTYQRYFEENILNVSSWNVRNDDAKEICSYVLRIKPTIMGFQDVTKRKAADISSCLTSRYKYHLGESDGSSYGWYNPIFYRRTYLLQVRKSGSFWLSDSPSVKGSSLMNRNNRKATPRVCTWLQMSFAQTLVGRERTKRVYKYRKTILNTLQVLTGKSSPKSPKRRVPNKYLWFPFYVVNTKLEDSYANVATRQMKIIQNHIRKDSSIMDRRGYPLIFMADLGWNYESQVYGDIEGNGWLIDSLKFSAKKFVLKRRYKNFIMRHRLKSLMSATLDYNRWPTNSQNNPVFAAYLSERSPKRKEIDDGMRNLVTGGK